MSSPGFYNDNQFRDWPFITRTDPVDLTEFGSSSASASPDLILPNSAIVDFGAIMDIDSEYRTSDDHIYLHSVSRSGTTITFDFRTTAPGATNTRVLFDRDITTEEFEITWEGSSNIGVPEIKQFDCGNTVWEAFLVTGDLSDLADQLGDGQTITYPYELWKVEPSRAQSLVDAYLRSLNLTNAPRTTVTPPPGCEVGSESESEEEPLINAVCVQGDIKWEEGYNCAIRQDVNRNAIIITAGVGAGAGEPCEEVPLVSSEAAPDDSPYLSGGPTCSEILKSINGVTGVNMNIIAGSGFRITEDPDIANTLIITRALDDFAICSIEPVDESSSVSASSSSLA